VKKKKKKTQTRRRRREGWGVCFINKKEMSKSKSEQYVRHATATICLPIWQQKTKKKKLTDNFGRDSGNEGKRKEEGVQNSIVQNRIGWLTGSLR
jgi:hypothetical protein